MITCKSRLPLSFYFVEGIYVKDKKKWWEKYDLKSDFHETKVMHSRPIFKSNFFH